MAYTGWSLKEIGNRFRAGIDSSSEVDTKVSTAIDNDNSTRIGAVGNINNPLLDLPLQNSLAMKQGVGSVTYSCATTSTHTDRYGTQKDDAIDTARFGKHGYLNEIASTNLFLNSDVGATQSITIVSGTVYTISFLEGAGTITLSDGGVGVADVNTDITFTSTSTNLICTVSGQADKVQVEALPFATSYIPTTTSSVTRATNFLTLPSYENLPPKREGGLSVDIYPIGIDAELNNYIVSCYPNNDNYISIFLRSDGRLYFRASSAGVLVITANSPTSTISPENKYRIGIKYGNGIVKMLVNGVVVATATYDSSLDIYGDILSEPIRIGGATAAGTTNVFNGYISNFKTYNYEPSDTEMALG